MQAAKKKNLDAFPFPILFASNAGQWPEQVKFKADMAGGYTIWFESNRLLIDARGSNQPPLEVVLTQSCEVPVVSEKSSTHFSNYYIGSDSTKWHEGVPSASSIRYRGIAEGVDLVFYSNSRKQLEFDYELAPGASLSQIQREFLGADSIVRESDNKLAIHFAGIVLHESIPVSYAIENNASVPFDVQYRVNDELVSFAANDDEMQSRVIDPVLYFSTYLGGSSLGGGTGVDIINDISVDPGNSMYVCGTTTCIDYPVKNWTLFNGNLLQGLTDAVVSKIWASGDLMFWSTYLGGTSTEEGINIAVDIQGGNLATIQASFVFASGHTTSSNFPTNVFPNLPYDQQDIFVTKFDATNGTFLTSRFYGGNLDDRVRDMAVSQSGKVYLVGQTTSSSLPIGISNPGFQPNPCVSSSGEAFAAALLEDFSVLYSTYLCGSFPDEAFGVDISVDTAIVVGHTASFDFAKTDVTPFPHSYRGSILMNANRNNGFCLALHPDGKSIVHGTFIGLNSPDRKSAQAVSVVERPFEKSIWVAGYASGEVPLEPTSFPGYDHTNTSVDGFVVHLTKDLSSLYQWTYLGSNLEDEIWDIDIDELGNAHLSGFTNSFTPSGFPPKYPLLHPPSDYDGSIYRGGLEAFAAELSNQLQVLHFFTYIGGGSSGPGNATSDVSYSNTYGANGRHFVVGQTSSIPVTQHFPNKFPNGINGYDGQDLDPISDGFLISSNCCIGTRGNIDNDSNESVDFSDLTVLVDFLFTSFDSPACYFESNLDGIDMVDISDLTELINHLFVSFQPLLSCPGEL